MRKMMLFILLTPAVVSAEGETKKPTEEKARVRYRSSQDVSFDKLLIEGDMKRPELHIITGETQQGTDGLLRLRDNFTDHLSMDLGENVP